jgi:hypothetical protein
MLDIRGCLLGAGQVAIMQFVSLARYRGQGHGSRLLLSAESLRSRWLRCLLTPQSLLVLARDGRLTFQSVGLGLKSAQLPRPRQRRSLQFLRSADRIPERRREGTVERSHGIPRLALPGTQIEALHQGENLLQLLGDLGMAPGQARGQPDITGCRVEAQVRHGRA